MQTHLLYPVLPLGSTLSIIFYGSQYYNYCVQTVIPGKVFRSPPFEKSKREFLDGPLG